MWEFFVGTRYLFAKKGEKFISLTTLISIAGIALGVAALIVVIGVMSGFDKELEDKVVGMNAHIIVMPDMHTPGVWPVGGIAAAADFVSGQAIVNVNRQNTGVLLKGIDPEAEPRVTAIGRYLKSGSLPSMEEGILIGSEFAKRFGLKIDDEVSFLSLSSKKPAALKVCGIFNSGMYEYDANIVIVGIRAGQRILDMGDAVSGTALKVKEPLKAEQTRRDLQRTLGYPYRVRTWMDLNRNLFSALKLEKVVMFIILALIVLVACFNVAGTLIMTVIEKTRDIGVLKSIGATNAAVMRIFMIEGFMMGAIGAAAGGAFGLWISRLIAQYPIIRVFGLEEIYYFDRLPVRVQASDFFLVTGLAVLISFLAAVYPAAKAARLNPVEALRYE
jgi:lipoprotein-releasing system permease protein